MVKPSFDMARAALIEPGNPAWNSVEEWAKVELARLRMDLEVPGIEQRKADTILGSILMLKMLLELPGKIRMEHKRETVTSDNFGIPVPGTELGAH